MLACIEHRQTSRFVVHAKTTIGTSVERQIWHGAAGTRKGARVRAHNRHAVDSNSTVYSLVKAIQGREDAISRAVACSTRSAVLINAGRSLLSVQLYRICSQLLKLQSPYDKRFSYRYMCPNTLFSSQSFVKLHIIGKRCLNKQVNIIKYSSNEGFLQR